jgi:iron complex outermembrane recepter protein
MRSFTSPSRIALIAGVSVLGLMASAGFAQTAEPAATTKTAATDTGISDIIVTATRTAQSLQSVPIAVSAFSGKALEERQITSTSALIQSIPNTTFTKGNFTGANLTIRGIGAPVVASSGDGGVGIAMNDMPLVSPLIFETEFYDMQRIEVLRGPQGTLFGRNATAGVMNFIPAKADTKALGAFGEFEYGNYNSIKVTGMVNVPINDKLAVRVAGVYVNRDGYIHNNWDDTQMDGRNSYSIRGSIHYEPTENLTVDLTGSYYNEDSDRTRIQSQQCITDPTGILGCQPNGLAHQHVNTNATFGQLLTSQEFISIAVPALKPLAAGLALNSIYSPTNSLTNSFTSTDPYQTATQFTPTYKANELILMGNVDYHFEKGTLTLIGGYTQNSIVSREDYYNAVADVQTTLPTNIATLNAFFPGKTTGLFSNGLLCNSEVDHTYTGYIGGNVRACSDRELAYDESSIYSHQWSAEAHYISHFDGKFNFLVGANYLNYENSTDYFVSGSNVDYLSTLLGLGTPGAGGIGSPYFDSRTINYTLNAYAGFGEAYFQATDTLKLTVGARYTSDNKTVHDVQPTPLVNMGYAPYGTEDLSGLILPATSSAPTFPSIRTAEANTNAWTGRAVLEWSPTLDFTDQSMFYASYSRGFKGGGINPSFDPLVYPDAKTTFAPEYINAFEVGMKNRALGGTLQANLTGFYYDYKGLQISRIIAKSSFNDNTNATIYGAEAEFIIQPVAALQFNANFSYLHTALKDLSLTDSRDPSAGRSDTVIIKDVTNAANCVVTPTAGGTGAQANAFVNTVNAAVFGGAGLKGVTPIGGTNTTGAFSVCNTLATLTQNPNAFGAGLGGLLHAVTGTAPGTSLPFAYTVLGNGAVALPDGVSKNLTGNQLAQSPEFKFSIGGQYNFDLSQSMSGFFRLDYNFTGNQYARNYNDYADRIAAYGVLDAQIQLNGGNGRYYIRGFVKNVFNSNAVTGMYLTDASTGLFTNVFTLDPRRYGVAVGFKY